MRGIGQHSLSNKKALTLTLSRSAGEGAKKEFLKALTPTLSYYMGKGAKGISLHLRRSREL
jgi:hypothetical protein